jgi:hypothetical protein
VKFSGELKFPEIDHPGVPVQLVIDDVQLEMFIDGESLGRWSLYDVHARRLVASAFQIDLDGTEVTFVADDPIDFAYRGVEHMAETWATLKSKRMATRTIAVRKSRRDAIPSRIEDMKEAMEANLDEQAAPRQIAGEHAMPQPAVADRGNTGGDLSDDATAGDWDRRDEPAAIPLVGDQSQAEVAAAEEISKLAAQAQSIEEEKQRLADERARFDEERRQAEQQEANRIEAYRLEMQRLEAEREELRRRAAELAEVAKAEAEGPGPESVMTEEPVVESLPELVATEEPTVELEPVAESEPVSTDDEVEPEEVEAEPEVAADLAPDVEPEPEVEPEPVMAEEPEPQMAEEPEPQMAEEPEPQPAAPGVLDLKELEGKRMETPAPRPASTPRAQPEPALAGAAKDRGGLMGAVKAAFRSGPKHHEHQFIEAPGGMGITRYVCEECGYVSISV